MSDSKHTPGPWALFNDGESREWIVMPVMREGDIARVESGNTEADARLIAAAPDLLAALKQTTDFLDPDKDPPHVGNRSMLEIARAAIAKAEGAP